MRFLVTGAGGQLGAALGPAIDARGHDALLLDRAALDITDPLAVEGVLRAAIPEAVIHAAAWTDVDGCEENPERARTSIVEGTRNVVVSAVDAFVVVVSTDYVFDGALDRAYVETDETRPLQVYGACKREAEDLALAADGTAVARTAWLYGARVGSGEPARNFVTAILRRAEEGPLDVVTDQVGSPTAVTDLAAALVELAERGTEGLFHVANPGTVSRAEMARAALRLAGRDPALVRDITTDEAPPRPARRPRFAPLDGAAWRDAGYRDLPAWDDALARTVKEILA